MKFFVLICAVILITGSVNAMAQKEAISDITNDFCHDSLKNDLLSSFHIDYLKGGVRVLWSSAKTIEIDRFEIQRAEKHKGFRTVGVLFPEQEKNEFVFIDKGRDLKNNEWYLYRIKMVNENKTERYSCIQKIKW